MDPIMLSVELGQKLRAWAESGEVVETLAQSKQRLIKELQAFYPDGAAVAAAMKKAVPPITFTDVAPFNDIKAKLIEMVGMKEPANA